jgi:hypothetical protein
MYAASLILAAMLAAQPTTTTPVEMLGICRYNTAAADAALMHHVVEITSRVTVIDRDGIGGYITKLEARVDTPLIMDRIRVCCYFDGISRGDLARIKPGEVVTVRGVVREMKDHLNYMVDPNVEVVVKNCALVVGAE